MDVQAFIAINVMALSILAIAGTLRQRTPGTGLWLAVNAAVVGIGAGGLLASWPWTGAAAGVLFALLVLAPTVLSSLAHRRLLADSRREALWLMRAAAVLHPSRAMRFNAAMLEAERVADPAGRAQALQALAGTALPRERQVIDIALKRYEDDWAGVLAVCRQDSALKPHFGTYIVRALGELGRTREMAASYEASKTHLAGLNLLITQLFMLAFCGQRQAVQMLLDHQLAMLEAETKTYWLALAARSADAGEAEWRSPLERLARDSAHPTTRLAAARHLSSPPAAVDDVAAASAQAIAARLPRQPQRSIWDPLAMPATLVLLVLVLGTFVLEELSGGSEDLDTLIRLGALWPANVLQREEWWRLGAAMFLHYGALHVGLNALMLLLLGRRCETRFGTWPMLAIYLLGGLVSMAAVLGLMAARIIGPAVLVGASGAIFALVGAEVAYRIAAWIRSRDALDRRDVVLLGVVILIQAVVDLSTPQVSFAAHASGFLAGAVLWTGSRWWQNLRPET